jgi:hypothetical protein
MGLTTQLSNHIKQVYFGGNWTCVHLKKVLENVNFEQAKQQYGTLNSILTLTHHVHYYVRAVTKVLEGEKLEAKDEVSFDCSAISNEQDWAQYKEDMWLEAERFATLIGMLDDAVLEQIFEDEKYGSYGRNLLGIIEHTHYHLGQIALLKKLTQMA